MKSMKAIILAGGLAGVLVIVTAFMNMQEEKIMSNLQTADSSKGFAVVELFTSEGCSSCPPADALVKKIQMDNKNRQIYILAFHVDYWDHQGWKDRFSDHEFSVRQQQYAGWLNLQTVYTPQIVVNGSREYVGSDQGAILSAISAGLDQEPATTLTLTGKVAGNKATIEYQGGGEEKRSELVLALIQRSAESRVKAGENAGSDLSHVQIVRQLLRVPLDRNNNKSIVMDISADFNKQGWELIGFVQHKTDGHIISAARFDWQSK